MKSKQEVQDSLDNLKKQMANLEATHLKVQGAIEFCENILKEKEANKDKKKETK